MLNIKLNTFSYYNKKEEEEEGKNNPEAIVFKLKLVSGKHRFYTDKWQNRLQIQLTIQKLVLV